MSGSRQNSVGVGEVVCDRKNLRMSRRPDLAEPTAQSRRRAIVAEPHQPLRARCRAQRESSSSARSAWSAPTCTSYVEAVMACTDEKSRRPRVAA